MKFSPSLLRKQGLSSSETDVLKPTESGTGRTEPERQGCEFTCRTGVFGWVSKRDFKQKGPSCPFAVPVAWFCPLWFLFFLRPCTALAAVTALFWKRELYKLCNIISCVSQLCRCLMKLNCDTSINTNQNHSHFGSTYG